MGKISLKEHLKRLKYSIKSTPQRRKVVLKRGDFPKSIKRNIEKMRHVVLVAALTASGLVLSIPAVPKTQYDAKNMPVAVQEALQQQAIATIVEQKTQIVQKSIIDNVSKLQQEIIQAKQSGKRNPFIRGIFKHVYSKGGLPGNMNYCVAGAMYAQILCNDNVLKQILPDADKTPSDYKYNSHPSVSCPYMRAFFRERMPNNYAERGDTDFKTTINKLEAGDIITISSSNNTSSGEHCVTCAGSVKNGKIRVKSFNNERDYEVPVSKIVGAALIIQQYRQDLTRELEERNRSINRVDYAVVPQGKADIVFTDYIKQMNIDKQRG